MNCSYQILRQRVAFLRSPLLNRSRAQLELVIVREVCDFSGNEGFNHGRQGKHEMGMGVV